MSARDKRIKNFTRGKYFEQYADIPLISCLVCHKLEMFYNYGCHGKISEMLDS